MNLSTEFNNLKDFYEKGIKAQKKLIKQFLMNCDKETLIEVLKERGIIKRDWNEPREKYEIPEGVEVSER